jgi:hypothetical protein
MFWMATLVNNLQVGLMTGSYANQHIGLVMFAEMGTETTLPVLDCFHVLPPGTWAK